MKNKWLAIGIILFFIGTCIIPVIAQDTEKQLPTSRGNWLYVGGDGPGNYSTIYEAMENASNGDTIYVYSGIYSTLTIRKSLHIIGENRYTTILDGSGEDDVVALEANDVVLSGFTIQNGGLGINLQQRTNVTVSDMIFHVTDIAIFHRTGRNILLENITFINAGASFWNAINCTVTHCIFNNAGISHNGFPPSGGSLYIRYNVFTNNSIINLGYLCVDYNGNTTIEGNNFLNNTLAIRTYNCKGVNIFRNNFIGNTQDVELTRQSFIREIYIYIDYKQHWVNNYWDDLIPKQRHAILGVWTLYVGISYFMGFPILKIPIKEYDNNPAKEPYNISGMN